MFYHSTFTLSLHEKNKYIKIKRTQSIAVQMESTRLRAHNKNMYKIKMLTQTSKLTHMLQAQKQLHAPVGNIYFLLLYESDKLKLGELAILSCQ